MAETPPPPSMRQTTPGICQWRARAAHASRTTVARALIIALLLGGFLAVGGAFDPMGHTLPIRLAFWALTMTSTTAAALAMDRMIDRLDLLDEHPRARLVLEVAITSIPLTGLVWLIANRFSFVPPGGLTGLFPSVVLITAVMTALNHLAAPKAHPTHAGLATSAPPRFLDRLPPKLRGAELYAVSAEDHYLRLHTSRGSDLILLRLADAIGELEGIEGAQTHRSWWVAKDAVSNARRADGRAVLTLKNGQEAPVSRSYAGALRKAGWY